MMLPFVFPFVFPFVGGVSVPDPVVLLMPSSLLGADLIDWSVSEASLWPNLFKLLKRFLRNDIVAAIVGLTDLKRQAFGEVWPVGEGRR